MGRAQRSCAVFGDDDYGSLDELCVPLSSPSFLHSDGSFTLCLWIYLLKNARPSPVIRMVCSESKAERPFLTIDQNKFLSLHPWNGGLVSGQHACPVEKWVHIGCEIGTDAVRLHMDGVVVAEMSLNSLAECFNYRTIILMGGDDHKDSDGLQGYAHYVRVLSQPTVTNHYVKHPPLELSLDGSTGASDDLEVEESGDGIWSVVGGKASCRRNFALDVVLLDALGRSVHKDMEIVALLVYADNGAPVEKPKDDAEAPLLTTFDGVEFPSTDRPIKLLHGRASFKLKISQLSSKCDNRLFRVCFDSPNISSYPFLRVFSRPIRCVSRNRNSRVPAASWKRPLTSEMSCLPEEATLEMPSLLNNSSSSIKSNSKSNFVQYPSKRPCMISEVPDTLPDQVIDTYESLQQVAVKTPLPIQGDGHTGSINFDTHCVKSEQGCTSQVSLVYPVQKDFAVVVNRSTKQERYEIDNAIPKFECFKPSLAEGLSDFLVFKYSLENTHSRAAFLKGVSTCWSDQELSDFSLRVSRATSCEHTGHQILIAKKLIHDGNEAWDQIRKQIYPVPWDIVVKHVEKNFQTLSMSQKRRFSPKDKAFLRQVAKCKDYVTREEFDRLWYWIYPVSLSLLNPRVRKTWEVEEPKCILAMVSRQEAEAMLMAHIAPKPGTFVLRFVSTCSWPHPDAGGMIVSFVGQDLRVHHKLLSLTSIAEFNAGDNELLSELIAPEVLMQPFG